MDDEELMQLLRTMPIRGGISGVKICSIAADRIEALLKERDTAEADLEKAADVLRDIIDTGGRVRTVAHIANMEAIVRTALAELESK